MSQSSWIAIVAAIAQVAAALATIGYLIASYYLWQATKAAAEAARAQATLTADAVRAATTQADVARNQFDLSRQVFLAEMQPTLWLAEASLNRPTNQDVICRFSIINGGKLPAIEVSWRIEAQNDYGLVGRPAPSVSPWPTEIQPHEPLPVGPIAIEPPELAKGNTITVGIEVRYKSPTDTTERVSVCTLVYDIHRANLTKTSHTALVPRSAKAASG